MSGVEIGQRTAQLIEITTARSRGWTSTADRDQAFADLGRCTLRPARLSRPEEQPQRGIRSSGKSRQGFASPRRTTNTPAHRAMRASNQVHASLAPRTTSSRPSRPPTLRSLSPPSSSLSAWVPINKSTVLGLAGPRQAPDCVLAYHQEQARAADVSGAAIASTPAEAKGSAALGPRARLAGWCGPSSDARRAWSMGALRIG